MIPTDNEQKHLSRSQRRLCITAIPHEMRRTVDKMRRGSDRLGGLHSACYDAPARTVATVPSSTRSTEGSASVLPCCVAAGSSHQHADPSKVSATTWRQSANQSGTLHSSIRYNDWRYHDAQAARAALVGAPPPEPAQRLRMAQARRDLQESRESSARNLHLRRGCQDCRAEEGYRRPPIRLSPTAQARLVIRPHAGAAEHCSSRSSRSAVNGTQAR